MKLRGNQKKEKECSTKCQNDWGGGFTSENETNMAHAAVKCVHVACPSTWRQKYCFSVCIHSGIVEIICLFTSFPLIEHWFLKQKTETRKNPSMSTAFPSSGAEMTCNALTTY